MTEDKERNTPGARPSFIPARSQRKPIFARKPVSLSEEVTNSLPSVSEALMLRVEDAQQRQDKKTNAVSITEKPTDLLPISENPARSLSITRISTTPLPPIAEDLAPPLSITRISTTPLPPIAEDPASPLSITHISTTPLPPLLPLLEVPQQRTNAERVARFLSERPTLLIEAIKAQVFTSPLPAAPKKPHTGQPPGEIITEHIHVVKARIFASPEYVLPTAKAAQADALPSSASGHQTQKKARIIGNAEQNYQQRIMNTRQHIVYRVLVGLWFCTVILFGIWWLEPIHSVTLFGQLFNSLLLFWPTAMSAYYFLFVARIYQPDASLPLPEGHLAMIVTKAPMEPWVLVKKTILAMKAQKFPRDFDIWLADEDPSDEVIQWCRDNQILVLSRKGIPGYHNISWPRRQKSKEGNLSFFYETCGYSWYDFVVQMDADHVPEEDYLWRMIEPFRDPAVGYVAAPSICDANARNSWAARARLYAEASLHGPLQAGYSYRFAPLCIGSHYAVRTLALEEIGGLGPELAEDHSTSLLFNSHGWRGAFALNAIAHGDGPECLADCMTQEFQWSRSLMKLLLVLTPKNWNGLPARLKGQFLFAQLWYLLSTLYMLMAILCPVIALITQMPLVNVNYLDFLWHFWPLVLSSVLIATWIKQQDWLRPANAKILSWEITLFQFVRWPWILFGVLQATISVIIRKELSFKVTPKGSSKVRPLPQRVLFPYTLLVVCLCLCAYLLPGGAAHSYHYFIALTILTYCLVLWVCIFFHARENREYGAQEIWRTIRGPLLQALLATCCLVIDLHLRWSDIISPFLSTPFFPHIPDLHDILFHSPFSR